MFCTKLQKVPLNRDYFPFCPQTAHSELTSKVHTSFHSNALSA
ncbi:hypothetical protein CES86_2511 [Brucella lupini]|uniref:Uncharacterized protein n=1 Tax=Brucella lupini TaxID=255457 RepID=A0A256GR39_9HYPH|nr:hypothetical protein CES86_2511 [Brucella lupini]